VVYKLGCSNDEGFLTAILSRLPSNQDTKEVAQLHAQMGVLHRALSQDDLAQSHLRR
jgi:hypothetical protein